MVEEGKLAEEDASAGEEATEVEETATREGRQDAEIDAEETVETAEIADSKED